MGRDGRPLLEQGEWVLDRFDVEQFRSMRRGIALGVEQYRYMRPIWRLDMVRHAREL